jgi:predicted ATP-dependent endonuclease of OLD family
MAISDIYLKSLWVDNYKSLKNTTIDFQMGLNIIIGQNGAGKSNLLTFIFEYIGGRSLNLTPRTINSDFGYSVFYSSNHVSNALSLKFEKTNKPDISLDEGTSLIYNLTINKEETSKTVIKNEKIEIRYPQGLIIKEEKLYNELKHLYSLGKRFITFELPENEFWISKPNRLSIEKNSSFGDSRSEFSFFRNLEFKIENELNYGTWSEKKTERIDIQKLQTAVQDILSDYLKKTSINSTLKNYTPISEIRFNPLNFYSNEKIVVAEGFSIDFLIAGNWMPWSYLSDGTKRLFYLVSECLTLEQGMILIEEPEIGIHPHQVLKILDFLNEQSRTKQVIISTHSPEVLDVLKENELQRIILTKYDKGTRFYGLTSEELAKAKRYMNEVGELSYYWLHSDLEK